MRGHSWYKQQLTVITAHIEFCTSTQTFKNFPDGCLRTEEEDTKHKINSAFQNAYLTYHNKILYQYPSELNVLRHSAYTALDEYILADVT